MAGHPTIPKVRTRGTSRRREPPHDGYRGLSAPTRINALPETTRGDDDRAAVREQEITQCELLMLKGFTTAASVQSMMGWDRPKTDRFIDLVLARWEITGGNKNFELKRGQQIKRVENLMSEAWVLYQNYETTVNKGERVIIDSKAVAAKTRILVAIGNLNKQLSDLHGITAKAVATKMMASTDRGDIVKRMEKQTRLAGVAAQMAEILRARMGDDAKVIEEVAK